MNQDLLVILIVLPFFVGSALGLYHVIGPLLISYNLTPKRIEIKLFRLLPIHWINLSDIEEIREIQWPYRMLVGVQWANRVFVRSFVLIKPKRSLYQFVRFTPKDPSAFAKQVRAAIEKESGTGL